MNDEQFVIEADVYWTVDGQQPLPRLIGPFATRSDAETWMFAQGTLWGDWNVAPLAEPASVGLGGDQP